MKKIIFPICILFFFISCNRGWKTFKGYHAYYPTTRERAIKWFKVRTDFYQFKKHETVVSIGAEDCVHEVVFGNVTDSLNFILENISSFFLDQRHLDFAISWHEKIFDKKSTSTYTIQIGNDSSTVLSSSIADKVLIENTFHEFSKPSNMLKDVYRILKPGGQLLILETMSTPKQLIHGNCNKRLYSEKELVLLIESEKFHMDTSCVYGVSKEERDVRLLKFTKQ